MFLNKTREELRELICNRNACNNGNATWWSEDMKAYYCPRCARKINFAANIMLCVNHYTGPLRRESDNAEVKPIYLGGCI